MKQVTTSVLIVGAGLTGLSAAAFLASHGLDCLLVERHAGPLAHPRARAINPRSVELYRGLGLEPAIRAARSSGDLPGALLIRSRTLTEPAAHETVLGRQGYAEVSPCSWAAIDQDRLEALVAGRARALGARITFGAELRTFRRHSQGVTAVVDEPGGTVQVRARYLVAADGGRSPIRNTLGVPMEGIGRLGQTITFLFEAALDGALHGRRVGIAHLDLPVPGTVLLPHDGKRSWVISIPYRPGEEYTEERCVAAVRAAIGDPRLEVALIDQLPDGTRTLTWEIGAQIATRYRHGPIFLAGDSAHVVPPTGALGASLGIQDAHNLAWRLAAVLTGRAGADLLDGYEAERAPVARLTLEQAMSQMRQRTGEPVPRLGEGTPVDYDAVVFGYRYGPRSDGPPAWPPGELRAQVGTRAPHIPLERGGRSSTIDLFGHGFVLLTAAERWAEAVRVSGEDVRVHRMEAPREDFFERYGMSGDGAVLVRPDGFVSWRAEGPPSRPDGDLTRLLNRLLHRRTG
ncbi:FAD-dependent monooxygenase [Nonomuraea glycinis]|uniref:FAD-dependent monooxygenase n=1 Tax=Nonomuraea glycinis TaxID=2047744 RepID=UPI0033A05571